MSHIDTILETLLDPEQPIFGQGQELYCRALGHEAQRREGLRAHLGVSPRHFSRHLKDEPGKANKTRRLLVLDFLRVLLHETDCSTLIIPLQGKVSVLSGSAKTIDDAHAELWNRDEEAVMNYATEVAFLVGHHSVADEGHHYLVVASSVIQCHVIYCRNKYRTDCLPPLRINDAAPFAPCDGITALDRFFCWRLGLAPDRIIKPLDIWRTVISNTEQERRLRRWRLGRIDEKGSEIRSDFICQAEFRNPCKLKELETRRKFEAVKAVHTFWRYLRGNGVEDADASRFIDRLLQIDDHGPARPR